LTLDVDIARLALQEERLRFDRFDEADAWALGNLMRVRAVERKLPLVIDIRTAGRPLFYSALPGTTPENVDWVRRKINVVMRYHKSSYRVGRELLLKGTQLDESAGVARIDFAPNGGCFPLQVQGAGVIGTITVSGIPQREDHNFVVACLCEYLGVVLNEVALPAVPAA
jgi:uncharacterized protein (UPF0303 family)